MIRGNSLLLSLRSMLPAHSLGTKTDNKRVVIYSFKNKVAVNFDHLKEDFIAALKRISWLSKARNCRVKAILFQDLYGLFPLWFLFEEIFV